MSLEDKKKPWKYFLNVFDIFKIAMILLENNREIKNKRITLFFKFAIS